MMANSGQQYCLRWNNHRSNLLTVFDQLLQSEAFTDVTLACEGGVSIKCHKMVLAACSAYFAALFAELPCKHPVVVLKDVKYADMKAILEYMYRGEVNVEQQQLTALIRVAETLKVSARAPSFPQRWRAVPPQSARRVGNLGLTARACHAGWPILRSAGACVRPGCHPRLWDRRARCGRRSGCLTSPFRFPGQGTRRGERPPLGLRVRGSQAPQQQHHQQPHQGGADAVVRAVTALVHHHVDGPGRVQPAAQHLQVPVQVALVGAGPRA